MNLKLLKLDCGFFMDLRKRVQNENIFKRRGVINFVYLNDYHSSKDQNIISQYFTT